MPGSTVKKTKKNCKKRPTDYQRLHLSVGLTLNEQTAHLVDSLFGISP